MNDQFDFDSSAAAALLTSQTADCYLMKEKKDPTHVNSDVCHFCFTVSAVIVTGSLSSSILLNDPDIT
jgi:hypothetical protein